MKQHGSKINMDTIHGKFLDANHWQYIFNNLFDSIYFYNKNDERKLPKSNISYRRYAECCL